MARCIAKRGLFDVRGLWPQPLVRRSSGGVVA